MSVYHTIANTPGFTAKAINHYVAAYSADGRLVAVFNTNSKTATEFGGAAALDSSFDSWNPSAHLLGFRVVKTTSRNDARAFFA